jgi:demethylmenaquinone methyltransferase/2-methoxy-6-polyprenyl-1,4-benzoquinol methylase
MNDVMSGGLHRLWKRTMMREVNPSADASLLDVAGGSGDITRLFLKAAPKGHVTLTDINEDMLEQGRRRMVDENLIQRVTVQQADAQNLPFEDNSFDHYTIAFGIRNVTDIDQALREAYRVLKPGGSFVCLEFSQVTNPLMRAIYERYSFDVIPAVGHMITGDRAAYQYLVESIRRFPDADSFEHKVEAAGFVHCRYKRLTQGVVAIHKGWKI